MKKVTFPLFCMFCLFVIFTMHAQISSQDLIQDVVDGKVSIGCSNPTKVLQANLPKTSITSEYTVESIGFTSYTTTTEVVYTSDDQYSQIIPIPFDFCFFGEQKQGIVIGSNGSISFDTQKANQPDKWSFNTATRLPDVKLPTDAIFGAYHDLNTFTGGSISYDILGTAPYRKLVVSYTDLGQFGCMDLTSTQQIVLEETTNYIEVHIKDKPVCEPWNNGRAIIGMQNKDGSKAYSPVNRNNAVFAAERESWRFAPEITDAKDYDFAWKDSEGKVLSTDTSLTVTATNKANQITAWLQYYTCAGTALEVSQTVEVIQSVDASVRLEEDINTCKESYTIVPKITTAKEGALSYLWSTGETSSAITVNTSGTYGVLVTIGSCILEAEISVSFQGAPEVFLGEEQKICKNQEQEQQDMILDATPLDVVDPSLVRYQWFFNNEPLLQEDQATITMQEVGTYGVEVSYKGCTTYAEKKLSYYDNGNCTIVTSLSRGLSPNNDAINDCFDFTILDAQYGIKSVAIYNADGVMVFKKGTSISQWCGESNAGTTLPVGTYFYVIHFKKASTKNGWVYINK